MFRACTLFLFALHLNAWADDPPESAGLIEESVASARESREARASTRHTVLASYAYLDMWVPSKFGIAYAFSPNAGEAFELGYERGSVGYDYFKVSIGRVSDDRFYLVWRRFGGFNSFNYFLGVHHEEFRVRIGDTLLRTSGGRGDILELARAGVTVGVGNRWQTRGGFTWSADWLVLHIPVLSLRTRSPFLDASANEAYRGQVDNVLRLFRDVPTAAALKIQLGFAF